MKFSYNWLQEYFKEKLPKPEKLAEILTLRSFEVENLQKISSKFQAPSSKLQVPNDYILNIDILPNRMPDCGGHIGIVREITAITKLKVRSEKLKVKIRSEKLNIRKFLEIKVEDKNLCPRYMAMAIENIKVGSSPKWLKDRLELLGINSINNIVDAANYIMLEIGQPTHIFDFDKIEDGKIIVRKAKNGEKITTLDNKEYELNESMLVIADSKEPLAIAGIKGGKKAEVDAKTKNIILESANFDYANIRKTSQKLNLRTDASIRFSCGLDPNLAEEAIYKLSALIKKIAGGEIAQTADIYPKKTVAAIIKLNFDKVRKVLGTNIADKEIKNILQRLNSKFQVSSSKFQVLIAIPTIRRDLQIDEDLIEEIGRIYGYEKIKPLHPRGELVPPRENDFWNIVETAKNFLSGQGFNEVYNYSFINESDPEILESSQNIIELQNPLSPELKFLRPNLIQNILKSASLNFRNYNSFRLFEIGKVFTSDGGDTSVSGIGISVSEKWHLVAILAGAGKESDGRALFYKIKGVASSLFETLGVDDFWFSARGGSAFGGDDVLNKEETQTPLLSLCHPYRRSQIKIGDGLIGAMGEIRQDVLNHYDIKNGQVVFFELDFDILAEKTEEEKEFRPFSKFPSIMRDLSLLVPREIRVEEVENIIENQGGELLADTDLFDIYEEEKFNGRKSLTFRLVFQSDKRTLLDAEVDKIMNKIIITLEENNGWEVRK